MSEPRTRSDIMADPRLAAAFHALDSALVIARIQHNLSAVEATALVGELLSVTLRDSVFKGSADASREDQNPEITVHLSDAIAAARALTASLRETRAAVRNGDMEGGAVGFTQAQADIVSLGRHVLLAGNAALESAESMARGNRG